MLKVTASKLRYSWYIYISYQMYANWYPPLLINFSIFFQPGHSYSNPPTINYWGKFPTETNFLKQYTCADLFAISQKEWPICSGFCLVSSCKEASTLFPKGSSWNLWNFQGWSFVLFGISRGIVKWGKIYAFSENLWLLSWKIIHRAF